MEHRKQYKIPITGEIVSPRLQGQREAIQTFK